MSSQPVIVAKFSGYSVFKIPEKYQDLPIDHFDVLWDTLYIYDAPKDKNPKTLCEIKSSCSAEDTMDWKRPDGDLVFDEQKSWPVEDSESESESESEEEQKKVNCYGSCCLPIDKDKSYYLQFPDGTEEWYCHTCQPCLKDNYIKKALYRGYGDGEVFKGDESDSESESEENTGS